MTFLLAAVLVTTLEQQYRVEQNADVVRLQDAAHDTVVSIMPSRGNIVFEMKVKGHDVITWPNGGVPLLAPWANRLDETAFYANGKRYAFDLTLGNVRSPTPIHGFIQRTDRWKVIEAKADASGAWLTSRLDFAGEPAWIKQWPFPHEIEVTHFLRDGALEVRTTIVNRAAEPMPVAIGFHPYFQVTDAPRDEWVISIGARTQWLLAENKLPTGETRSTRTAFGDPHAIALKGLSLDDVFGDLERDANDRATMTLRGKSQRLDVVFGPNYKAAVVYSPAGREFVCFEPMAAVTNGLNLAHKRTYRELQSIAPGGAWSESFWVKPSGFSQATPTERMLAKVDHLVYATPDLNAGIAKLEALLGVRATTGGQHPGRGTRNALIALGPSAYIEIIGPDPEQPTPAAPRPFGIDRLTAPKLVTWSAKESNLAALSQRAVDAGVTLGTLAAGSRRRPDGVLLSWNYTSPFTVVADGIVPFFINWGTTPHPAASAVQGGTLLELTAEHPNPASVSKALAAVGLDLAVKKGSAPALVAIIDTPRGRVELR